MIDKEALCLHHGFGAQQEWRVTVTNLILFINSFLSYLLLFVFIVVLVVIACIIGAKWGKSSKVKQAKGAESPTMPETVDIKE